MRGASNPELASVVKRYNRFLVGAFMACVLILPLVYRLIQIHDMELQIATDDFQGFQSCDYTLFDRPSSLVRLCSARPHVEIHALSFSDLICAQKLDEACAAINTLAGYKPLIESLMGGLVFVWMVCCFFVDRTMHQIAAILEAKPGDVQDPEARPLVGAPALH